ncbi:hypothetical protein WJX74_010941 [Apatococcus lobatus]|uniref:DUF7798 domain-containing protein n=1 Tax=Apatococcus lobatus TaxID=904363 RepID=A0AAW1QAJ2_9CHLO
MQEPASDSQDDSTSEIQAAALSGGALASNVSSAPAQQDRGSSSTSPRREPAAAPATAKPWAGWGGWGSISTTLTGIAAATAKDLSDLSSNLQNVIVVDPADGPSTGDSSLAPLAARDARGASLVGEQDLLETAAPSAKPEDRDLASDSGGQESPEEEMDRLAQGVGSTLTGLWGGAKGMWSSGMTYGQQVAEKMEQAAAAAARELQETVEDSVRDMRETQAFRGIASAAGSTRRMVEMTAAQAEQGLEGIAERAVALIENTLADPLGAGADYPGSSAKHIDGFDSWFRNQGGAYSAAVLASLAADCSRQCSQMPGSSATQYQEHTLNLKPLFDLKTSVGSDSLAGLTHSQKLALDTIDKGHKMLADLAAAGVQRAADMADELLQQKESRAQAGSTTSTEQWVLDMEGLEELRQEGARRMAELAALSLERLLALARSLLACFRDGQPTNDNIHWPAVPELQAMLLQSQGKRMVAELEMLASGFLAALRRATRNLTKPSQPSSHPAASPSSQEDALQSNAGAKSMSRADSPANDKASLAPDTGIPSAAATGNAGKQPDTTDSQGQADPASESESMLVLDNEAESTNSVRGAAATTGAIHSSSTESEADNSQSTAEQSVERGDESMADEVSHPTVEPGMERSDVVDAQTFGRRLIEALKADGQTAVGWVLQTFPKLLPFVMLSALRLDDDDYEEPEEE